MRGRIWRPGRQTPKVRDGAVQKKHRWDYYYQEYDLAEGHGQLPVVYGSEKGEAVCRFTSKTAMGFLLMHVFLHELGHHFDRMQTKNKIYSPCGEDYAENHGNALARRMWPAFFRRFGF